LKESEYDISNGLEWFARQSWEPFEFQLRSWHAYLKGRSGLLNAPTGSGKTYALLMPVCLEMLAEEESGKEISGLRAIWITPLRALAKEIGRSAERLLADWGRDWKVAVRTGDTSTAERRAQKKYPPQIMITTPETLHVLLAQKGYNTYFRSLKSLVVDEWHELLGSKRGVQVELGLSRLKGLRPDMKIWGISATIGNMEEAMTVLLGDWMSKGLFIKAEIEKVIHVESIMPDDIEKYPWAGHLGIRMLDQVIPVINQSKSTLIFTNTRSFCEIWYQKLLDRAPDLAGQIAMHHGSISKNLRAWVEDALHDGLLKAVVCTSSLDLGVDFRPVESVVQIGSPKGVARFIQRAGRSGHRPGEASRIYFVPTHALELVEAAALKKAMKDRVVEARIPYIRSFDVLLQYLMTLGVSDGFTSDELFKEVLSTHAYSSLSKEEWQWCLNFLVNGGEHLEVYEEYHKMIQENGIHKVVSRRVAQRHRMSIGTIVSDKMLQVRFMSGGKIGTVEEGFISRLTPGDVFWFSGRALEFVRLKGLVVQVRRSKRKSGKVPSFQGGRMPLSSQMSKLLRESMQPDKNDSDPEYRVLAPILDIQRKRSIIPSKDELLMEYFRTKEGYHLVFYPFEGRLVHEGMGSLIAYRISLLEPLTFSIAMNDYGVELLSEDPLPIEDILDNNLFTTEYLSDDIKASVNATEMARRRFRDISHISGLIFQGFPGKHKKERHMQASSGLLFNVFYDYDPHNLLLRQSYEEAMDHQLEEGRLREALERISHQRIVLQRPERMTPFAFPIIVDRMSRSEVSSEKLEDRVAKMQIDMKR